MMILIRSTISGKNIIPKALAEGRSLYAYSFNGYWKDAGTIPSYYEASMELLDGTCNLDLDDPTFPVYSKNQVTKPQYIGREAHVTDCYVCDGCTVLGEAVHSIISNDVYIGRDAKVYDSIILHGARIEDSAEVYNAIIDENVVITAAARSAGLTRSPARISRWSRCPMGPFSRRRERI